jgi:hypothetical protein
MKQKKRNRNCAAESPVNAGPGELRRRIQFEVPKAFSYRSSRRRASRMRFVPRAAEAQRVSPKLVSTLGNG